jgi:hypothetical protein
MKKNPQRRDAENAEGRRIDLWRPKFAKRLDCGSFSAALNRMFATLRTKSGDESPQSRRFARKLAHSNFGSFKFASSSLRNSAFFAGLRLSVFVP